MRIFVIAVLIAVSTYFYLKKIGLVPDHSVTPPVERPVPREGSGIKEFVLDGLFNPEEYIESGIPTVIEFYTRTCPGCRQLRVHYKQFLSLRPDVAIRRFQLKDYWQPTEVWADHGINIGSTPHIIIYDAQGNLLAQDEGLNKRGFKFLYDWMNREISQARR